MSIEREIEAQIPSLRRFARALCRDVHLADDLVQDTLERALGRLFLWRRGSNLRAWLFTILRNTFYSNLRKSKREVSDTDGAMAATLSEKPEHDGRLAMADFEKVFGQLPVEQREALILVGASGLSYEEAAETCQVAVGTIKSRVNRGRCRLVELLDLSDDDALEMTDRATLAVVNSTPTAGKSIA